MAAAHEEDTTRPLKVSGNARSATCVARASVAPTISPASGTFYGSQWVTLANAGPNTDIWYTTDGSTPVPGSGTTRYYTAPFIITSTTTVKAVGMWGARHEPLPHGYVPSNVVSATYTK